MRTALPSEFRQEAPALLLASRAGRCLLSRLGAATCVFFAGDRDRHIRQVAFVVMRAQGWA